ncbi:hypothetical protein DB30_04999 [Enhygromyxa salina]|uniref:Uncharacterized protein n=1 Tax=Enhygromyxa salina TaxID=215803 RepID=A0A0C2D7Z8_9BACT|nr:hypothetical protein DB30_04999 [Enhygromyxa salina]
MAPCKGAFLHPAPAFAPAPHAPSHFAGHSLRSLPTGRLFAGACVAPARGAGGFGKGRTATVDTHYGRETAANAAPRSRFQRPLGSR